MTAAGLVLPMAEDSHFPPTPGDFWQPLFAIPGTAYYFTRPCC
jgi:F-type H+-transporting ATPase subunit a